MNKEEGKAEDDTAFAEWVNRVVLDGRPPQPPPQPEQTPETVPAAYIRRAVIAHLDGARPIRSGIEVRRTRFTGDLHLANLEISFPLFFLGCEFEGAIRGAGAKIRTLGFTNSVLRQGADLRNAHVDGHLFLRGAFQALGPLILRDMVVGGTIDLRGSRLLFNEETGPDPFSGTQGDCLGLSRTEASALLWTRNPPSDMESHPAEIADRRPAGLVTLRDLKVRYFQHDLEEGGVLGWPEKGQLLLDGFAYDRIQDASRDALIQWLALQNRRLPGPYFQLASVLEKQGRKEDASQIRAQVRRNEVNAFAEPKRSLARAFFWPVDYGASALRALGLALGFFVFFLASVVLLDASGGMTPDADSLLRDPCFYSKAGCSDRIERRRVPLAGPLATERFVPLDYPRFLPFEYSLETFLPVLDFDQRRHWAPASRTARFVLTIVAFLGLFLGSLSAAAVSGLLMPRSG